MLSDRNYMNSRGNQSSGGNPADGIKCVFILIAINVFIFLSLQPSAPLYNDMALSTSGIKNLHLWQGVTSMFLHGGFSHLLVNMWGLYLFGTIIAPMLGAKRFLILYFVSGVCGNLLWLLFNWNSYGSVIGASGALFGVMIATAMLYPDKEFIMLFFPFPMKTKTLVVVYAVIEIISELSVKDNIAHLAHLGGVIGGYFYIKYLFGNNVPWDLLDLIRSRKPQNGKPPRGWKVHGSTPEDNDQPNAAASDIPVSQKELDYLLDKISQQGINSLSEAEMTTLKKAREQMRRH